MSATIIVGHFGGTPSKKGVEAKVLPFSAVAAAMPANTAPVKTEGEFPFPPVLQHQLSQIYAQLSQAGYAQYCDYYKDETGDCYVMEGMHNGNLLRTSFERSSDGKTYSVVLNGDIKLAEGQNAGTVWNSGANMIKLYAG